MAQLSKTRLRYSFIKIMTGSDLSKRRLPLMRAESGVPGPLLWLTACGHGDEVGGIVIIQELFRRFKKQRLVRGAVRAFPLMNPIGFETASRFVTLSKEDLNRSFPGNAAGTPAERIADKIFTTITQSNPELVLDLHNDWIQSIPYTLLDRAPLIEEERKKKRNASADRNAVGEKTVRFARSSGFIMVRDSETISGTLTHNLILNDIPALTLEMGESYIVNETNIEYGLKSIYNLLAELGMIEIQDERFQYPLPERYIGQTLDYYNRPLSSSTGIVRYRIRPGDAVKQGDTAARIHNAFGKLQETLLVGKNGIMLGHADSSVVFPGMSHMSFAVERDGDVK